MVVRPIVTCAATVWGLGSNSKQEELNLKIYSYLLKLVHHSWISYTLKMEAIRSSETSVNKISTRLHIPEDGILHELNKLQRMACLGIPGAMRTVPTAAVEVLVHSQLEAEARALSQYRLYDCIYKVIRFKLSIPIL
jgi:hypothetical protein